MRLRKALAIGSAALVAACFLVSIAGATDTGPNAPGTVADAANGASGDSWSNVNNAKVSDTVYATNPCDQSDGDPHGVQATNFGFSIPSGATINGITATVVRKSDGSITDTVVKLVKGGVISGTNLSAGAAWPGSPESKVFGGSSNLWGLALTDTDVNASTFGVFVQPLSSTSSSTCYIDFISLTVSYTTSGGGAGSATASTRQLIFE